MGGTEAGNGGLRRHGKEMKLEAGSSWHNHRLLHDTITPAPKRILVADDADAVTTVLVTALEVNGFHVTSSDNGQDAFELASRGEFDLAIIDQLMSGMLGIDVLKRLRMEGNQLPVIILSGVDDDEIVVNSLKSGAADFIQKPFRLPELLARIERHLTPSR